MKRDFPMTSIIRNSIEILPEWEEGRKFFIVSPQLSMFHNLQLNNEKKHLIIYVFRDRGHQLLSFL